ncbi:ABC transporter permease [Nonomuraea longicatena]|uniref:ABC transporter permease n=1 Tax=Nonomuraea longicatena TaxID=83682 RepID=A0ABP4AY48_9ACTN
MIAVFASEWTKMRSVRSTVMTIVIAALMMIGLGVLFAAVIVGQDQPIPPPLEGTEFSMSGTTLASLAMATLGVLVISSEYRTGAIRVSLLSVPQRMRLLSGKIVVFTTVALVASAVTTLVTFFASQAILGSATLGDDGVPQVLLGTTLYLTASGLFGLALGALVRHTPGAIVAAISMINVVPTLVRMLPGEWGKTVGNHFTTNAGMEIVRDSPANPLGAWGGFAVYLVWIAVTMVVAAVLLDRRDA